MGDNTTEGGRVWEIIQLKEGECGDNTTEGGRVWEIIQLKEGECWG